MRIQTRPKEGKKVFKFPTSDFFYYTPEDIYGIALDEFEVRAIMNTLEVADKCCLKLDLGKLYMPDFDITKDQDWDEYKEIRAEAS